MKLSRVALAAVAAAVCGMGLWALQRRGDYGFGDNDSGSNVKAEFYWSRLAYHSNMESYGAYGRRGFWGFAAWSRDYPKADRQFLIAMHRLTRIDGRPTEQVVSLDNDDIFNYPWIYAVQVEDWTFTPAEAKRLREYLLKGGFLMVDDFHGTEDWENFMNGMRAGAARSPGGRPAKRRRNLPYALRRGQQNADAGRAVCVDRAHL